MESKKKTSLQSSIVNLNYDLNFGKLLIELGEQCMKIFIAEVQIRSQHETAA